MFYSWKWWSFIHRLSLFYMMRCPSRYFMNRKRPVLIGWQTQSRLSESASERLTTVANLVHQISALKSCSSAPFELWLNQEAAAARCRRKLQKMLKSKQKRLVASLRLKKLACAAVAAVVSELGGIFPRHWRLFLVDGMVSLYSQLASVRVQTLRCKVAVTWG